MTTTLSPTEWADPTEGVGTPRKYHGMWIWPIDGYYDVHYDEDGRCSDDVAGEYFATRAEAQEWIDADREFRRIEAALDRALGGDR